MIGGGWYNVRVRAMYLRLEGSIPSYLRPVRVIDNTDDPECNPNGPKIPLVLHIDAPELANNRGGVSVDLRTTE